jgi:4-hydroxy-tetrahydrodipicolinate reductase
VKLALIGYGKMGKQIEETAAIGGHEIVAIIDPYAKEKCSLLGTIIEKFFDDSKHFDKAEVAIEFTQPDTVVENIFELSRRRVPAVIGTTGWYDRIDEVKHVIEENGSSLLYAPNFSLGVNIFYRIVSYAAKLMNSFPDYDVGGFEIHHNEKKESPSGTAKILAERILAEMKRKKKPVWGLLDRKPAPDEFHFASMRTGAVPGTHTVLFDSTADSIEITHTAHNRGGFALGAIESAEWLISAKRKGVFTIDDFLEDV